MSKKLIENIHYMYAQTSKSFVAYDIIDTGKYISVLQQDKKGGLTTFMILPKNKLKFRKMLKEIEGF